MNAQVTGFRVALGFVLLGAILASAISGAASGAVTAVLSGGSIAGHALIGALFGGGVGWVLGSYAHGIGYTLLSINDQLAELSGALKANAGLGAPTPVVASIDAHSGISQAGTLAEAEVLAGSSWRERLEKLPVDQSVEIKGLLVWKLKKADGKIYYSGDRSYASLDDLLTSYKVD